MLGNGNSGSAVVTINNTSSTTSATACDTYTWSENGTTYTTSGTYTNTTTNTNGCPNVATLNLTINNSTSSSLTVSACDSYTWSANGNVYTTSGVYSNVTTNAAGCPNTATLNLTISPTVTPIFNAFAPICAGAVTPVLSTTSTNGVVGTWSPATISSAVSGAYTYTFTPSMGQCATLATINVVIDPLLTWYADADGDTYGNLAVTQMSCAQPTGFVANSTDCDDANANVNPGKAEIAYNGIDDNCDGNFDEGFPPMITSLTGPTCGSTLANNFVAVHATQIPGATGYRFRVTNMTSNSVQIIDRVPFF